MTRINNQDYRIASQSKEAYGRELLNSLNEMNEKFVARIAEAYSHHSEEYASILEPILKPMADEIVALGQLKAGELVLDVATGTGLIARTAAGCEASVIGIDISLGMLTRARALSAGTIPFIIGDAHSLPFENQNFDLVTCGLSLSHFSDVSVALGEIRRVLRPGGRFLTSAWGSEGRNPTKAAAVEVRNRFLEDKESTYQGTFNQDTWANPERGSRTLGLAGFADVQVTTQQLSGRYRDSTQATEVALAWPVTRYRIGKLNTQEQRQLREETAAAILEVDDLGWLSQIHYYQAFHPGL